MEEIDSEVIGSQHLNEEAVACTIGFLESVENPESEVDINLIDWRTQCGIIALQLRWMRDEKLRRV